MGLSRRLVLKKNVVPYIFKINFNTSLIPFKGVTRQNRLVSFKRFFIKKKIIRRFLKRKKIRISRKFIFIYRRYYKKKSRFVGKRFFSFNRRVYLKLKMLKSNYTKRLIWFIKHKMIKVLFKFFFDLKLLFIVKKKKTKYFKVLFNKQVFRFFKKETMLLKSIYKSTRLYKLFYIKNLFYFLYKIKFNFINFLNIFLLKNQFLGRFFLKQQIIPKVWERYVSCLKRKSKNLNLFNIKILNQNRFLRIKKFKKLYFWRFYNFNKSFKFFYYKKNFNNLKFYSRRRILKRLLKGSRYFRRQKIKFLLKRFFSIQKKIITGNPSIYKKNFLKFIRRSKKRFFFKRVPFYPFSLGVVPDKFTKKTKITFKQKFKKFHILFRMFYKGISPSKLWKIICVLKNKNLSKNTFNNYLYLFEFRLDVLLFRFNLVKSIHEGFFFIKKGYVLVNGRVCRLPFYVVQSTDIVSLVNKTVNQFQIIFLSNLEKVLYRLPVRFQLPKYFEFNFKFFSFIFLKKKFSFRLFRFFPFNYKQFNRFKRLMSWGKYSLRA